MGALTCTIAIPYAWLCCPYATFTCLLEMEPYMDVHKPSAVPDANESDISLEHSTIIVNA